jgi:hypothetical protein
MPTTLQSRAALFAAAAVMFLPVASLSPRGITHLLTCRQSTQTPFTVVVHPGSHPVLATSLNEPGAGATTLCGGLAVDLGATPRTSESVTMRVTLTNRTAHPWRGTVALTVGAVLVPLPLGRIGPGGVRTASADLHLQPGAHELQGALLLGP